MGKEERSTGEGASELSERESILEELIEINKESEQRAGEDNYAKTFWKMKTRQRQMK